MRYGLFISTLVLFLVFPSIARAQSQQWYYPVGKYNERHFVKDFGTLIDNAFYQGKEALFPATRYYGYHAAVDLEAFADEQQKDIPVYAVADGKIVYVATVQGYGGLILEQLTGTGYTALYGHIKITNLPFKVGDTVASGQRLTYLGNPFSIETAGERKHLHFGVYKQSFSSNKGTDLYFNGHEPSLAQLQGRWENPTTHLQIKNAVSPGTSTTVSLRESSSVAQTASSSPISSEQPYKNFLQKIFRWLQSMFRKS